MSLTKRLGLIVGAAASLSSAMAQTAMDQSRAYQNELFSDASRQVSKQGGGAFTAKFGGYEQVRFNANFRDDPNLDNEFAMGFQNARTRINAQGNVFNEDWGYFIQFGFGDETIVDAPPVPPAGGTSGSSTSSGFAFLEDAYGTYKIGNGWDLRFGQFKLPFLREQLIGDTHQLAVDRSTMDTTFSQQRSQGIQVGYAADAFRFFGAFSDGLRTANTDFVSPAEADLAITARFEYMWAGAWTQADDFTSWQNSAFFGMVGAAAHYQMGGRTFNTSQAAVPPGPAADAADVDAYGLTVDVSVKGNGWNAFAAGVLTNVDPGSTSNAVIGYPGNGTPGGAGAPDATDYGFLVQGGIFVAPQWELFGRLDFIDPDTSRGANGDNEMMSVTLGANYYISPDSHAAKFTAQLQYFLERQAAGINPSSTLQGLLGSNEDGQFTISAQMQLVF
jgi:hypothetical protein